MLSSLYQPNPSHCCFMMVLTSHLILHMSNGIQHFQTHLIQITCCSKYHQWRIVKAVTFAVSFPLQISDGVFTYYQNLDVLHQRNRWAAMFLIFVTIFLLIPLQIVIYTEILYWFLFSLIFNCCTSHFLAEFICSLRLNNWAMKFGWHHFSHIQEPNTSCFRAQTDWVLDLEGGKPCISHCGL